MKLKNNKNRLMVACLLAGWNIIAHADILTDGTVGDIYYLFGDNMIIPESYGTRVGDNLFHSFSMFNIYSGEAVTFTGSNTLQNVIARVTGGDVSMINGILSSNIGKANFYFINPAGVTFGKNAVVDVPAAFHVSTANQINFVDGSVYSATNPAASTLTIAKPESFGFLGQTGDIVLDGAQIVAKENQTIDLVANNITLKNEADLYAPAGEVRLVAAKGSQNVSLVRDENGFLPLPTQTPNAENSGNISIDNSVIDTTGNGGGRATLWGNNIMLNSNAGVFADNDGFLDAMEGKGTNIQANLLSLNKSLIISSTLNFGNGGDVTINAKNLNILNGGAIATTASSQGNAGNLKITTNQLRIDEQESPYVTGITSQTDSASMRGRNTGNAGNITINAKSIDILNGGNIFSAVFFSEGNAGNVAITTDRLKIDGYGKSFSTGIFSVASSDSVGSASAGSVMINAGNIGIINGGIISTGTHSHGYGNAGNINIIANQLTIDGKESPYFTGITSQAGPNSGGNAGNLIINAGNLGIFSGGEISSATYSQGQGGDVIVTANSLKIDGQRSVYFTGITSGSETENTNGNAGDVIVNVGDLEIFNGGAISTDTFSQGRAGDVNVTANRLIIDGQGNPYFTGISSDTISQGKAGNVNVTATNIVLDNSMISSAAREEASGKAGNVTVTSNNLNLFNGSQISVANNGSNDAGNILINTHTLNAENNSFISTFAKDGNGGNITVNADDYLYLENSGITTTTNGTTSNGGNININSPVLVMNTGLIQANAVGGHGGDINLNIQALIPSYNSLIIGGEQVPWQPYIPGFNVIQAASEAGVNGTVNVSSPQFDISGSISGLKTKSLESPAMRPSPCNLGGSSLKRKGKGGLSKNETELGFIPPATLPATSPETSTEQPNSSESTQIQDKQPCTAI